jgi:hypothetical protein
MQWKARDDRAVCSGLVQSVGYPGRTRLTFCEGKVCQIRLSLRIVESGTSSAVIDEYVKLHERLAEKYGDPHQAALRASPDCHNNLQPCLIEKAANFRSEWQWASGQRVVMTLVADEQDILVWLTYVAKDAAPNAGL